MSVAARLRQLEEFKNELAKLLAEHGEKISVLEAAAKNKEVAPADVIVSIPTPPVEAEGDRPLRRPSVIVNLVEWTTGVDDGGDDLDHLELSESMWDACLFLFCKDNDVTEEDTPAGEKSEQKNRRHLNVGAVVSAWSILALVLNGLVQTAIVAVVVNSMADDASIDDGTAADLRCISRCLSATSPPCLVAMAHPMWQGIPRECRSRPR
jgi:hypothetical protein